MARDAGLEGWLADEIGLDPRALADEELGFLRARFVGSSEERLVDRLAVEPDLRDAVVDEVVVPETWFFRDPDMVRVVVDRARELGGARILSVPCSTGEEPLGLAIALCAAGVDPHAISIDAVDVSPRAIRRATRGVFTDGAFRATDDLTKLAYFEAVDDGARVAPEIAELVTFQLGNVLDLSALPLAAYDFVLCRNLFIYLHEAARVVAAEQLRRRLTPDGLLLLGPAEVAPSQSALARVPGAPPFVWRASLPVAAPPLRRAPSTPPPARMCRSEPAPSPRPTLGRVRALADAGEIDAARALLGDVEARSGPSAELYYLKGLLHLGDHPHQAEQALQRALYLDENHEDALAHLARLLERRGAADSARVRARLARVRARQGGSAS